MKLNKKGFTIVELVIVIAVIAILAAVLIPTFSNVIAKANQSSVLQAAKTKFEEAYALDYADGIVDAKENGEALSDTNYSVNGTGANAKPNYSYTDATKGYTATYDGTEWKVTESSSPASSTPSEASNSNP